jgi:translation initiation factor IF-2
VYQGRIASLRRFKEDVHEVHSGYECGISLDRYTDIKRGDVIEPFVREQVAKKLAAKS